MAPQPAITLGGLLAQRAASHAHHTALQWDGADPRWQRLDYATLAERAHAMARALPVERGLRVAWLGFNHPAQLVLLFALGLRGAVLVPLNYRLAPAEWATILDDCAPLLLLHDDAFAEPARALAAAEGLQAVAIESLDLTPDESVVDQGRASDAALIVYTSGTTGDPKGAVHTQANLLANMAIAAQVQAMNAHDTVLTALPLFHVGGLCIQTLPALSVGARVLLHRRFDPGAVLDTVARERPTLTLQVPATLQALLQHPHWSAVDLSCLCAIWPFSIALGPDRAMELVGSCGWPAPGVEVKLVDEQGEPVARGRVGEICVRAPNVAQLYWPDVDAVDSEGFFHSGDLARQEAEGQYVVVGRSKDMIISGGENIYPAEIEQLLAEHPWVAECAVVGRPDERWGEVCVAVVVLRETAPADDWTSGVEASLHGRLARYKWPRMWHRVDALPRTALGKVVKPAIRAWLVSQR